MTQRLLDTDTLIDIVRGVSRPVGERFTAALGVSVIRLSAISMFEFQYGMLRSPRHAEQEAAFADLLLRVEPAGFDPADAERTASLKAELASRGRMLGPYDLLIAGQALARGWTVVTSNTREFGRVDGIQIEDWRAPL